MTCVSFAGTQLDLEGNKVEALIRMAAIAKVTGPL